MTIIISVTTTITTTTITWFLFLFFASSSSSSLFVCVLDWFSALRDLYSTLTLFVSISCSSACYIMLLLLVFCWCARVSMFSLIWLHIHACALAHRSVIYWIFLFKTLEIMQNQRRDGFVSTLYFCWKPNGLLLGFGILFWE